MTTVGSFDAKTHLPELLERVAKGETVRITRRGIPIAKLVPMTSMETRSPKDAARHIRELRKGLTLGNVSLRALMNEGRR